VVRDRGYGQDEARLNPDDTNEVASQSFLAALSQSTTAKSVSPGPFRIALDRAAEESHLNRRGIALQNQVSP
jgi:hypothetical protein